jgi:spore germination cell wall hydrolase CwlJ-like protein
MISKNFLNLGIAFLAIASIAHSSENDITLPDLYTDVQCLADNIYHEARDQSFAGQLAVAHVTLNRVMDARFPDDICDVVHQGPVYTNWKGNELPVRYKCQFSWYCDGLSDDVQDVQSYEEAYSIALEVLSGHQLDFTNGATHYHTTKVNPWWARSLERTVLIDDHIFYRRK